MLINVMDYTAVYPRIVPSHSEQKIVITPKYEFVKFKGKYIVNVIPRYQFTYDSERKGSFIQPFEVYAKDNQLELNIFFGSEQEYIINVAPEKEEGKTTLKIYTSVYALDEDLFSKKVIKGDLHMHTTFSDGLESPEHRAVIARKNGFDFIAITDHNAYAGSTHIIEKMKKCPNNMAFIHGEEVHATCCPVHILSLGSTKAIAPQVTCIDDSQKTALSELKEKYRDMLAPDVNCDAFVAAMDVFNKIREAGGVSVLCHIYWSAVDGRNHMLMGAPEQLIDALVQHCNFDAFEITSGAPENDLKANYLQETYYRENLPEDFPVIGITDTHTTMDKLSIFGKNYTVAFVDEFSESGILKAIRGSKTVAVDGVGTNVVCHGSLRLIKYTSFLIENYFTFHDKIVQTEGDLMQRILEGNHQFLPSLDSLCKNSVDIIRAEWGNIYCIKSVNE